MLRFWPDHWDPWAAIWTSRPQLQPRDRRCRTGRSRHISRFWTGSVGTQPFQNQGVSWGTWHAPIYRLVLQQVWSLIRVGIGPDFGIKGCYLRHWVVLTLYMDLSYVSLTYSFWLAAENVSVGKMLSCLEAQLVISTQCDPTVAGSVMEWSNFMRLTIWRLSKYFHHLWNFRSEWAATA